LAAPREFVELVERFERNVDAYMIGSYNETKLRREFGVHRSVLQEDGKWN